MAFLDYVLMGNSVKAWLGALAAMIAMRFALGLVRRVLVSRLKSLSERTQTRIDDVITTVLSETRAFFLWSLALQVGVLAVSLPDRLGAASRAITATALLVQIGLWGSTLLRELGARYVAGDPDDESSVAQAGARQTAASTASFVLRILLWTALTLVLLDTLGVNISALVAGLGVGGVAVALAVQNILGDLFGSITIALDKPFVVGDFIVIDDFAGTVEHVGLKTTRIRSLHGEQLVFSNADLLRARIKNYKHLAERRVVFSFGVTYDTSPDDLEAIPGLLREIISAREGLRFDRAHFKTFAASSLDFEVVYYACTSEYALYMDHQQAINLALLRGLAERKVEFAYPTQTLYLQRPADSAISPQ